MPLTPAQPRVCHKSQRSRQSGSRHSQLCPGGREEVSLLAWPSSSLVQPRGPLQGPAQNKHLHNLFAFPNCWIMLLMITQFWSETHQTHMVGKKSSLDLLFMFPSSLCVTVNRIVQTVLFSRNIVWISAWIKKTELQTWLGEGVV